MKLAKNLRLPSGTVVPKGTELHFSTEGKGYYRTEEIEEAKIPQIAVESEDMKDIYDGDIDFDTAKAEFEDKDGFVILNASVSAFTKQGLAKDLGSYIFKLHQVGSDILVQIGGQIDVQQVIELAKNKFNAQSLSDYFKATDSADDSLDSGAVLEASVESVQQANKMADAIIKELSERFGSGFNEYDLASEYGGKILGFKYTLHKKSEELEVTFDKKLTIWFDTPMLSRDTFSITGSYEIQ